MNKIKIYLTVTAVLAFLFRASPVWAQPPWSPGERDVPASQPAAGPATQPATQQAPPKSFNRAGKVEAFAIVQGFLGSSETSSENIPGGGAEFDDTAMFGFGLGVNLTDHINLNMEVTFGSTDLTLSAPGFTSATSSMDTTSFLFNVDLNMLKTRFTPFVTTGLGVMDFNGDFNENDQFVEVETNFSYAFGGGLRWDINNKTFMKLLYRRMFTKLSKFSSPHEFDTIGLYLGAKY